MLAKRSCWRREEDPFEISKSLRFSSGDSSHLSRTPVLAGNRKTWTWSGWVKRSKLGAEQALFGAWLDNSNRNICRFNTSDQLQFLYQSGGTFYGVTTTQVFRDPSAWIHLVLILNTNDSTEADRAQIYVNGSRIADADLSSFGSGKYPPQNTDYTINNTVAHHIGARKESGALTNTYNDGYLAEVHFIDGQALAAASDFGEYDTNNVWQPKAIRWDIWYEWFRLDFNSTTSNQTLGYDASIDSSAFDPRGGFGVVNYTGGGIRAFDLGFQPDLVWIKAKANGFSHQLYDSVRGVNLRLNSNSTNSEATAANSLTAFNFNGFSLGSDPNGDVNGGGPTDYIAWAWKAGGTAGSNTDGSITSQVSASNEYGFSVVTFSVPGSTPYTVGHGLGSVPKLIILKKQD